MDIYGKNSEELVSRLSYEIVKEVAPDELDLFDDFKEEFLKNPDAFLEKDPKKREEMLGFVELVGVELFFTSIVLPVVSGLITNYLSKKLEKKPDSNKIKEFRDDAFNRAISLGIDKEKAELIADSTIGTAVQLGII
jgi:hypothetical protein